MCQTLHRSDALKGASEELPQASGGFRSASGRLPTRFGRSECLLWRFTLYSKTKMSHVGSATLCLELLHWAAMALELCFGSSICSHLFLSCRLWNFCLGATLLGTVPWTLGLEL